MSIDAILTVVGVGLAVIALVPNERAQDLQVRLGRVIRLAAGIAAAQILYWAFLEQVHALPGLRHLPRPIRWSRQWDPANASLLVLLVLTGIGLRRYRSRLPVTRLSRLGVVLSDALARRRHSECIHLLEAHLPTISRAHRGDYLLARLRERHLPTLSELVRRSTRSGPDLPATNAAGHGTAEGAIVAITMPPPPKYPKVVTRLAAFAEGPRDAAHDIIRLLSRAPSLTQEMASAHPYLGREILRIESSWLMDAFAEDFARALLRDPVSALYRELRGAENLDGNGWPRVDAREQPLLAMLCEDVLHQTGPRLAYTFLQAGIDPVLGPRGGPLHEALCGPTHDYHERGRWTSPPYFTVALLQILVPRVAAGPNVEAGFLNLYVAASLAEALVSQLVPSEAVDTSREWPTPTHYLLYELVDLLVDAVRGRQSEPESPTERTGGGRLDAFREHAAEVLGAVMDTCLRATHLDSRFKGYLLGVWWRAYADKYHGERAGADQVLAALAHGGYKRSEVRNAEAIRQALMHIDIVLQVSDSAAKLKRRFGIA